MSNVIPSARRTRASPSVRNTSRTTKVLTNHDCAVGQVGKLLGERWKALSEKQRGPYEAKAKADKQRYEDEKASYNNVGFSMRIVIKPKANQSQAGDDDEDEE